MDSDFHKSRRNLVAISGLLIVFDFAEMEIAKVGVLGTELIVGNTDVLVACVWIGWAYLFLRYYQHWNTIEEPEIRKAYTKRLCGYVDAFTGVSYAMPEAGDIAPYTIQHKETWQFVYEPLPFDDSTGISYDSPSIPLPLNLLIWWVLKSVFFLLIQTPLATKYLLPFVIATAAPLVTIWTTCLRS